MRLGKIIRWSLLATLIFLAGAAGTLYFLACGVPDQYRPAQLTPEERTHYATTRLFQDRARFDDLAQQQQPFEWSIQERHINGYLASMDEIAYMRPDHRRGEVDEAMRAAGLAGPAVDLHDGIVTLMVHSTDYDKILSADFSLEVAPEGLLRIRLVGARVGYLPVPRDQAAEMFDGIKRRLAEHAPGELQDGAGDVPASEQAARLLAALVTAIDGDPVSTEARWEGNLYVRVDGLTIDDDALTMHVVPARHN